MKKNTYPPKRITFVSLLLRAFIVVLVLFLIFIFAFKYYLIYTVDRRANNLMDYKLSEMQQYISKAEAKAEPELIFQEISVQMAWHSNNAITIEDPLSFGSNSPAVQISPQYSQDCHAINALTDKNGRIVASNREIIFAAINFAKNDNSDKGWYVCDNKTLHLQQVDQLYSDYRRLAQAAKNYQYGYVEMELTSAYVNKEKRIFIPHEGNMILYSIPTNEPLILISNQSEEAVREINITLEDDEFELMELHRGKEYPHYMMFSLYGETQEVFDRFNSDVIFQREEGSVISNSVPIDNGRIFSRSTPIYINKQTYFLYLSFIVNYNDPQLIKLYWKYIILFAAFLIAAALLWCWRKNVINKSKYAFEDYQRDLTDRLAHDIKTPLMAISGYAENALKNTLSETEQTEYLSSILNNVSFTDSLISRTLYLNHIGEKNVSEKEVIQLTDMVEDMLSKYALILDEKRIIYSVSGAAEIHTDRTSMETIIENLISNAIKYTTIDGSIKISVDKKHITVTNSVDEKIDTTDLNKPFVRGDLARSNTNGNGLGLAIAERAALANGFSLSLSCTDTEFITELKF